MLAAWQSHLEVANFSAAKPVRSAAMVSTGVKPGWVVCLWLGLIQASTEIMHCEVCPPAPA